MIEELTNRKNKYKTINEGYKIILNASYGKMGSFYSPLYSPKTLLQVTLTGQLTMLMVIEKLEAEGIDVIASNTDSITYICKKDKLDIAKAIVFEVELESGLIFEFDDVERMYMRDINAYVAVFKGYVKAKGIYAPPTLNKDSEYTIVFKAIREYLLNGTSMEETIRNSTDINEFVTARVAKYGAYWRGQYLGKLCRAYYSTDGDDITFTSPKTGSVNKVAKMNKVTPAMDLPDTLPDNLDYDRYIDLAHKHLKNLGGE